MQVSDRDGYTSRSNAIKANSKIVKERIWTLDSPSRQQDFERTDLDKSGHQQD